MRVLMVVDMQRGFIQGNSVYERLKDRIDEYIDREAYDLVVYTKFKNIPHKNSLYVSRLDYAGMRTPTEQSIVVHMSENYVILEKFGYALDQEGVECIQSLGVDSIDMCGIQADACVYAIALQLFDMGVYPNILMNYVATEPSLQDSMRKIYEHQFGAVDDRN